jgi:hypothetical protein
MAYRTLGELRSILLARLGMGGQGAAGTATAIADSLLSNGQSQIYWQQDWKHLIAYEDKTLGVGQNLLDYPDDCAESRRVLRVETVFGGQWRTLQEGIQTEQWNNMDVRGYPFRYEAYAQFLMYPRADQTYTVRFWYVKDLDRFTQDADRATLDDEMVLLHALANGKAHYRHPDAPTYQGQLDALMARIRGQSFVKQGTYYQQPRGEIAQRPQVLGRDV